MAPGKTAVEFDAIINQDRQRRKNEALAKEIFGNGKGRRSSAPGAGIANRKPGTGPSLASRIGVQKRTTTNTPKAAQKQQNRPNTKPVAGNVDAEWTHDLHTPNNPSASRTKLPPNGARASKASRNDRIYNALNTSSSSPALNSQFNIVSSPKPSGGISIRGLAGPYVVMAKNFAFGTTAADIESAMTPVGGVALSCRLIAERPTVIAEIIFETKEGADNVVETFNNQNADGHLLKVYHKVGALPPSAKIATAQPAPVPSAPRSATPLGPRAGVASDRSDDTRSDTRYGNSDRYAPRERSRDRRRDYPRDDVMDGSFGFDDRMDTDEREDNSFDKGRGLYSDSMINRNNGRGRRTYR